MRKTWAIFFFLLILPASLGSSMESSLEVQAYDKGNEVEVSIVNKEDLKASNVHLEIYTDEFSKNYNIKELGSNESINYTINRSPEKIDSLGTLRWNVTVRWSHEYEPVFDMIGGDESRDLDNLKPKSNRTRNWPVRMDFNHYSINLVDSASAYKTLKVFPNKVNGVSSFNINYKENIQGLKIEKLRKMNSGTTLKGSSDFTMVELEFRAERKFNSSQELKPHFLVNYSTSDSGIISIKNYGSNSGFLEVLSRLLDLFIGTVSHLF